MPKRKGIVEVDINDDRINSIEDIEQEILAQDIYGQIPKKYLDSLQDDMAQHMNAKKGSKMYTSKRIILNLTSRQKEYLMKCGKRL